MFSIIEWNHSPETDPVLVRGVDEGRREVARPARLDAPAPGETLVCFKSDAPSAEESATLQTLFALGKLLDGALLARVVLPKEASHDLPALAAHYGLKADGRDAPARALAAAEVFARLVADLKKKPLAALDEMRRLLAPTQHPLRPLIEQAAKLALKSGFGARAKTLKDLLPAESGARWITREPPQEPPSLLDVERVCGAFRRRARSHRASPRTSIGRSSSGWCARFARRSTRDTSSWSRPAPAPENHWRTWRPRSCGRRRTATRS